MSTPTTIDPQMLEGLRELNPDDPAFLRELIDLFIADVADRLVELERALANSDASLLLRAAHTIKGSSSNFGAVELIRISQIMESQGKTADFAGATATMPALKAAYAAVSTDLKNFR